MEWTLFHSFLCSKTPIHSIMVNMRNKSLLLSPAIIYFLCACSISGISADLTTAKEFISKTYINYQEVYPDDDYFYLSDGYSNNADLNGAFGVVWNRGQIQGNKEDGLIMNISRTDDTSLLINCNQEPSPDFDPFLGSEIRTTTGFKYGYFGAYMKTSNINGTVTAFFSYTGPSEDQPHDEIDFEFLGKNPTKVQLNYYSGNDFAHEVWLDLDFDSSQDYHHYGFYWDEKDITWYIDFKPVYRQLNISTPSHECKIFTSFWKTNSKFKAVLDWAGDFDEEEANKRGGAKAYVKYLEIADVNGNKIEDLPVGYPYMDL